MKLTPEVVFHCFSHAIKVSCFDRLSLCESDAVVCSCAHWVISSGESTVVALNHGSVYLQLSVGYIQGISIQSIRN